jgi:23S rRNA-/tRNA-specific pseudouridylate synthase
MEEQQQQAQQAGKQLTTRLTTSIDFFTSSTLVGCQLHTGNSWG